jgi:hypothetical protein
MFPTNAIILLVKTNCVRQNLDTTIGLRDHSVEVFDHTEAITAQGKVVGHVSSTTVAKIKGLLAMEWRSRIGIWNSLCETEKKKK